MHSVSIAPTPCWLKLGAASRNVRQHTSRQTDSKTGSLNQHHKHAAKELPALKWGWRSFRMHMQAYFLLVVGLVL